MYKMSVVLDQLVKLGPKLGASNQAALEASIANARKGDLQPLIQLVRDLEAAVGIGGNSGSFVADYDAKVLKQVENFSKTCSAKASELMECVTMVNNLFQAQRKFLQLSESHRAPSDSTKQKILEPTAAIISEIQNHREKNRGSEVFNHLSMVSESIAALGWVGVAPAPVPFIREMKDAGQFYANRVIRERKEDKAIVDSWILVLTSLGDFVKEHHTTGLVWNSKGTEYVHTESSKTVGSSNTTPVKQKPLKQFNFGSQNTPQTEKLNLDGKKWIVEHFKGNKNIKISAEPNQSVSIYKCEDSIITVEGKCNNIVCNSSKKVAIVLDSLISSAEIINTTGLEMQVLGRIPTVILDKTDSGQIYLSKQSEDCEIVTAKTAGINVMFPTASGDFKEYPVPEQFKTTVKGIKLTTNPVDLF